METEDSLTKLRRQIREIDTTILELVARRQELARRVGEWKLSQNIPIKDDRVEKEVIKASRHKAQELGIYEDLAERIFRTLIEFSCKVQEDSQSRALGVHAKPQRILIAGGLGGMGQWLAHFFDSFGHEVLLYDLKVPLEKNFPCHQDFSKALEGVDVVVLSTPVSETAKLIDSLVTLKSKALVFDVCSIKAPLITAFAHAQKAKLRLTSIHPMFGPQVQSLAGRHIIICETDDKRLSDEAASLFRASAARLEFLPLEKHDEYMAYILGLSHLCNLIFAGTLAQSQYSFQSLNAVASTTFSGQLQVSGLVVTENPELYYEIQAENPFTPAVMQNLKKTLADFSEAVEKQDRNTFKALMEACRLYFQLPLKG